MFRLSDFLVGGRRGPWPGRPELRAIDRLYAGRARIVRRRRRVRHQFPRRHADRRSRKSTPRAAFSASKIDTPVFDTQSDAGVSRGQIQKVLDNKPYVIFGPVYSGSVLRRHGDHASRRKFRRSSAARPRRSRRRATLTCSAPRSASSSACRRSPTTSRDGLKAKTVALVWVNNDFGKGGRDNFIKEMAKHNIKVVADVSTELGQTDFSADVVKVKAANADAIFVYINEEECARFLKEAKKQGIKDADRRRDHLARPEGDRSRRRRGRRRAGPRRASASMRRSRR